MYDKHIFVLILKMQCTCLTYKSCSGHLYSIQILIVMYKKQIMKSNGYSTCKIHPFTQIFICRTDIRCVDSRGKNLICMPID